LSDLFIQLFLDTSITPQDAQVRFVDIVKNKDRSQDRHRGVARGGSVAE